MGSVDIQNFSSEQSVRRRALDVTNESLRAALCLLLPSEERRSWGTAERSQQSSAAC